MDDINDICGYSDTSEQVETKGNYVGFGTEYNCKYENSEGKVAFDTNIEASSEDAAKVKFRRYRSGITMIGYKVTVRKVDCA